MGKYEDKVKGKAEQAKGKVKEAYGKAKEKVIAYKDEKDNKDKR